MGKERREGAGQTPPIPPGGGSIGLGEPSAAPGSLTAPSTSAAFYLVIAFVAVLAVVTLTIAKLRDWI